MAEAEEQPQGALNRLKAAYYEAIRIIFQPFFLLAENSSRMRTAGKNNFELGVKELNKGNYRDAIVRFKLSLFFDKDDAQAYVLLAKAYAGAEKPKDAEKAARKALELSPGMEEAAQLLQALEQPKEA